MFCIQLVYGGEANWRPPCWELERVTRRPCNVWRSLAKQTNTVRRRGPREGKWACTKVIDLGGYLSGWESDPSGIRPLDSLPKCAINAITTRTERERTIGLAVLRVAPSPAWLFRSTHLLHSQGIRQARHIPDEGYAVPDNLIYQRSLFGKDQNLDPPVFEPALLR